MLTNATLTRIDRRLPADAGGAVTYRPGRPMVIRVGLTGPGQSAAESADAVRDDRAAQMTVLASTVAGEEPRAGDRVRVRPDNAAEVAWNVTKVGRSYKGHLSSLVCSLENAD